MNIPPPALETEEILNTNLCKGITADDVEFINLLTKTCSRCNDNRIMSLERLYRIHKVLIPHPLDL